MRARYWYESFGDIWTVIYQAAAFFVYFFFPPPYHTHSIPFPPLNTLSINEIHTINWLGLLLCYKYRLSISESNVQTLHTYTQSNSNNGKRNNPSNCYDTMTQRKVGFECVRNAAGKEIVNFERRDDNNWWVDYWTLVISCFVLGRGRAHVFPFFANWIRCMKCLTSYSLRCLGCVTFFVWCG